MSGTPRQSTQDISYAYSVHARSAQILVRFIENITGRLSLLARANGYKDDMAQGQSFWHVMMQRYGIDLDITQGSLDLIPKKGPLVVVSNHPYGILDGLVLGYILSQVRPDFKIIAHRLFDNADDINKHILPISFDQTRTAYKQNMASRKQALADLDAGGAIGIFPGGTVSTALNRATPAVDPRWRRFSAKMIARSNAAVVPLYFEGSNSPLFHIASRLHYTLRVSLFIKEFKARTDGPVRVKIGNPLPAQEVQSPTYMNDADLMMKYLRTKTYELSHAPHIIGARGYEFEERYRN